MKNLKKLAPVLLSLALFPACAKKHSDAQPAQATPPSLQNGDYLLPCKLDVAANMSKTDELVFDNADGVTETTQFFTDGNCQNGAYGMVVKSHYKLGAQTATTNVYALDEAPVEVDLVPFTQNMAVAWNQARKCNVADWQEGQAKSVLANGCTGELQPNITIFTLVKFLDANNVQLGTPNLANRNEDGLAPERRYSLVDDKSTYTRKGSQATQPVQPNPDLTAQCPALASAYMCDIQGDEDFAGRDIQVTKNGADYRLDLRDQSNNAAGSFDYVVDGQQHAAPSGLGYALTITSSCSGGDLNAHSALTNRNQPGYSLTEDRRLRIVTEGNVSRLVIDTVRNEIQDPSHAPVKTQARIECRQR